MSVLFETRRLKASFLHEVGSYLLCLCGNDQIHPFQTHDVVDLGFSLDFLNAFCFVREQRRSATTVPMATRRCWRPVTDTWQCFHASRPPATSWWHRPTVRGYWPRRSVGGSTWRGGSHRHLHSALSTPSTTVNTTTTLAIGQVCVSMCRIDSIWTKLLRHTSNITITNLSARKICVFNIPMQ